MSGRHRGTGLTEARNGLVCWGRACCQTAVRNRICGHVGAVSHVVDGRVVYPARGSDAAPDGAVAQAMRARPFRSDESTDARSQDVSIWYFLPQQRDIHLVLSDIC